MLKYKDCVMYYKDLGGILLSKLNHIDLEMVKCSHCHHMHSDNGKFAYTPHRTHLCLYCGHLFRVKERNIGSELATILPIPEIKLHHKKLAITSKCRIGYDLLKGILLINNQNVDRLIINEKEVSVSEFLDTILENEY